MQVQEPINKDGVKNSRITSLGNVSFDELYGNDATRGADESAFYTESKIKFIEKKIPKQLLLFTLPLLDSLVPQTRGSIHRGGAFANVQQPIDKEGVKDSRITSLGNVSFNEIYRNDATKGADESPFNTELENKFIGKEVPKPTTLSIQFNLTEFKDRFTNTVADNTLVDSLFLDEEMKEADSDLQSMHDDEIMSLSNNDKDIDDFKEFSKDDEVDADHVIDELVNMANTKDATLNVFAASSLPEKKIIPRVKIPYVYTLGAIRRFKEIQITKASGPYPLEGEKTLKAGVDELVLKPSYKEFNVINTLESQRWNEKHHMQLINYLEKMLHSSVQVQRDIMVINAKKVETKYQPLPGMILRGRRIPSLSSFEFPPPKMTIKGKGKTLVSDDDQMKQVMTLMDEGRSSPNLSNLRQFRTTETKSDKKRKRRTKLIHEVFFKENIVLDGMQRNLTLPKGVDGKAVREPEVYDELIYEIGSRANFIKAREIIEKNLDASEQQAPTPIEMKSSKLDQHAVVNMHPGPDTHRPSHPGNSGSKSEVYGGLCGRGIEKGQGCDKVTLVAKGESGCEMNVTIRDDRYWHAMSGDYFFDVQSCESFHTICCFGGDEMSGFGKAVDNDPDCVMSA
nr:hypothetical protein [Tanacetum cinerariifolium]